MTPTEPPTEASTETSTRPSTKTRGSRPSWRFFFTHPAHVLALGLGSGMAPVAPGTFGTLFGWIAFRLFAPVVPGWGWAVLVVGGFVLGWWVCDRTGRDLGVADHGAIVWDEIVAMWLVLCLTPPRLWDQLAAFLLFRVFDIAKPPPIGWLDRQVKGGLGVMIDDIVAALFALAVLLAGEWAWSAWHG